MTNWCIIMINHLNIPLHVWVESVCPDFLYNDFYWSVPGNQVQPFLDTVDDWVYSEVSQVAMTVHCATRLQKCPQNCKTSSVQKIIQSKINCWYWLSWGWL